MLAWLDSADPFPPTGVGGACGLDSLDVIELSFGIEGCVGPMIAVAWFALTARSMPCSACVFPKNAFSFSTLIPAPISYFL